VILRATFLIILLTAVTTTAHSQHLTHDFQSFPATSKAIPRLMATPPPTHWLEGGLIGGIGLGALFAYEAGGLCESSDCTKARLAVGLLGGGLGFIVGALIGGQFPKHTNEP
jgi:predicted MFS family arabinose efflux permease